MKATVVNVNKLARDIVYALFNDKDRVFRRERTPLTSEIAELIIQEKVKEHIRERR